MGPFPSPAGQIAPAQDNEFHLAPFDGAVHRPVDALHEGVIPQRGRGLARDRLSHLGGGGDFLPAHGHSRRIGAVIGERRARVVENEGDHGVRVGGESPRGRANVWFCALGADSGTSGERLAGGNRLGGRERMSRPGRIGRARTRAGMAA